jgi:carbon storage regulator
MSLVLSRKIGESIVVPNCELRMKITEFKDGVARIVFDAPKLVKIYREEVWKEIQKHGFREKPGNPEQGKSDDTSE